jgi:hypothetical protein
VGTTGYIRVQVSNDEWYRLLDFFKAPGLIREMTGARRTAKRSGSPLAAPLRLYMSSNGGFYAAAAGTASVETENSTKKVSADGGV